MPELAILYEPSAWFAPLFAVLDRRGVDYVAIPTASHSYDPADRSPQPAPAATLIVPVGGRSRTARCSSVGGIWHAAG